MSGPTRCRSPEAPPAYHQGEVECDTTLLDTSLVNEDFQKGQRQQEFSHLQKALGLKEKITPDDLKKYKYGDDLAALDADKPTGLKRELDVVLLGMTLEVRRNDAGAITAVAIDVARFDTRHLASESPKDFITAVQNKSNTKHYRRGSGVAMSDEGLGYVCYHIQSMIFPCATGDDRIAWGVHDHTDHKWCFVSRKLFFVFSNKEAAVYDLQSLGFDPEYDYYTYHSFDLRELNRTFLTRCDAKFRGPYTGGQRTKIPENEQLSTLDEILKARKCFPSWNGGVRTTARDILRAATKMVSDDATTTSWARTREQLDGGQFRLSRRLRDEDEANIFLVELDLARARPSSERIFSLTLDCELRRFGGLPQEMKVAFSAYKAQRQGLLDSFAAKFHTFANARKQSHRVSALLQLASAEARVRARISPATEYSYQAPVIVPPGAVGAPETTELQIDADLPPNLATAGRDYQKAGRNISRRLQNFLESQMESWPEAERVRIKSLYSIEEHTEYGVSTKYPRMKSNGAFERLARKVRASGWTMDDETAGWFIIAIRDRRKLRNWHDRLPREDSRFKANDQHEAWLQTLIKVVVALVGHQAWHQAWSGTLDWCL